MSDSNNSTLQNITATGIAGVAGYKTFKLVQKNTLKYCIKPMYREAKKEMTAQNSVFKEASLKMLSGMKNIGVVDMSRETKSLDFLIQNDTEIEEAFNKTIKTFSGKMQTIDITASVLGDTIKEKFIPEKIKKIIPNAKSAKNAVDSIKSGENACCMFNKIFVNFDKLAAASFHEAGHAQNYLSKNPYVKFLKIARANTYMKFGLGAAFLGAITTASKKDNSDKGFAKKYCLGIAALSTLPLLAEEGLASYKGYKMASKALSPQNLNKLAKFQGIAWLTYAATTMAAIAGVYAADKIKDTLSK